MFDLGTKIMLVASSCHKKTGPRKYSVGYVTTLYHTQSLISNRSIFVTPSSIKFLHYGNEKKYRFETKQVLLVFPIIRNNIKEGFKTFTNMITSDKYVNAWNELRASVSMPESIPIAIAAPIYTPEVNFKTCTYEELCCWFESCLLSHIISSFVNRALISHHPFKGNTPCIDKQDLTTLRGMIISKQVRHDIMNTMYEDVSIRNKWIKTIRMASIISEGFEQESILNNLYEISIGGLYNRDYKGVVLPTYVYKIIAPYVFRNKFETFKNVFINKKGFSKIIKEMEDVKKIIFGLT